LNSDRTIVPLGILKELLSNFRIWFVVQYLDYGADTVEAFSGEMVLITDDELNAD
jgi:hypothetical protein